MALPTSAIIGIVVAVIVLLFSVSAILFYYLRLRKIRRRRREVLQDSTEPFLAAPTTRTRKNRETSSSSGTMPLLFEPLQIDYSSPTFEKSSLLPRPVSSNLSTPPNQDLQNHRYSHLSWESTSPNSTVSRNTVMAQSEFTPQALLVAESNPWTAHAHHDLHEPLQHPPALFSAGTSTSSSTSSSSPSLLLTPSSSSFNPSPTRTAYPYPYPYPSSASSRKSPPPTLPPLIIPLSTPKSSHKKAPAPAPAPAVKAVVTPTTYASQHGSVATLDLLPASAVTIKPPVSISIGSSSSRHRRVSLVDPGFQSHRDVPSSTSEPGPGPVPSITHQTSQPSVSSSSLSDVEPDSASAYSQSSALTQSRHHQHRSSTPWMDDTNAPSVPEIPERFREYYFGSPSQTSQNDESKLESGSGAQRALPLPPPAVAADSDFGLPVPESRKSSIEIVDINASKRRPVSSFYSSSAEPLKLPPPLETPIYSPHTRDPRSQADSSSHDYEDDEEGKEDEEDSYFPPYNYGHEDEDDPLARANTTVGRLLKARAKRQVDRLSEGESGGSNSHSGGVGLERSMSTVSRIEREDSIRSVRSVGRGGEEEDRDKGIGMSYKKRMYAKRKNRKVMEDVVEEGFSQNDSNPNTHNKSAAPTTTTTATTSSSIVHTPPLQVLPNPFEKYTSSSPSPSISPSNTIRTIGTVRTTGTFGTTGTTATSLLGPSYYYDASSSGSTTTGTTPHNTTNNNTTATAGATGAGVLPTSGNRDSEAMRAYPLPLTLLPSLNSNSKSRKSGVVENESRPVYEKVEDVLLLGGGGSGSGSGLAGGIKHGKSVVPEVGNLRRM
ncbi:hypothetical protein K435DRAFT_813440 [Dendrothele bispora CBS 962.96]|uniref:Uncharacterized protein n=1 Tax=Dendrothele bispora (strain CBS 962.96) TaxID=1314807 RepID=A0A4S8KMG9_DENBC|nr:hypothetical protein K435DRAFT_813440 [Dendrothele bispora CBS 962.96]